MQHDRVSPFARQLDPIRGRRGQAEILREMRRAILDGGVTPGAIIFVDEVAELFGVSSIPVREALKTLIGEGLVIHRPRLGYSVAHITTSEYRELYVVCEALELAAIPTAMELATAEDDAIVTDAHAASERALRDGDELSYQYETKRFHEALIAPSRMRRLMAIVQTAWNMTEPGQPMVHSEDEERLTLQLEHTNQLNAFLARDADRLAELTRQHYVSLYRTIDSIPKDTGLFRDS